MGNPSWLTAACAVGCLLACGMRGTMIYAQDAEGGPKHSHILSGTITDSEGGETVVGAAVWVPELDIGTVSNQYGFFSLTLPSDSLTIIVSHVAFRPHVITRRLTEDLRLDLVLEPALLELEEVEVRASGESQVRQLQMSQVNLPIRQVQAIPALLGEVDILKVIQLLPGVQTGGDGTTGLYVRGGGPDQNLFLLDGTQIYNPSHIFGFLSTFNGDAIKDVKLLKGGFPARYGGRLSSVVDITMKEGNLKQYTGMAAVGLLSSRFSMEGPIRKDRASFLLAGRRSYADLLMRPFMKDDEVFGYYFYDVNAKTNVILSPRNRLYLSAYTGHDRAFFRVAEDTFLGGISRSRQALAWRNLVSTFRWNHVFSPRLFVNTIVGYTRYRLQISADLTEPDYFYESTYLSGIQDWHARMDFEFMSGGHHYVRFGVGGMRHDFVTGALTERYEDSGEAPVDTVFTPDWKIKANQVHVYLEDEVRLSSAIKLNAGVHGSGFEVEDKQYLSLQPRFSLWIGLGASTSLKASYARMRQYIHLLATARGLALPTDLWVPSTDRVRPQQSAQVALGIAQSLNNGHLELSLEGFHKRMTHLIDYKEGANYVDAAFSSWQDKVVSGRGTSYGAELFLQKKSGQTTGWLGYTLSWATRTFDELNYGETFPYRYDHRHDVSLVVTHQLKRSVRVGLNWIYGTGQALTLPIGQQISDYGVYPLLTFPGVNDWGTHPVLSERNAVRMPAYHRLDVAVHFNKQLRWASQQISIGVFNAYNRRNPFSLNAEYDRSSGDYVYKKFSLLPAVPSFTYQLTF
ncbi:MAG: TonB-dependent receptor [Bacteroidota bacterium]|nr:TonB-dependent receptor [Bacteroidota bacterium]